MSAIRAVGLLSGGLDSALAARMLIDQGIEVIGVHLESPTACRSDVRELAGELGIKLEVRPKGDEYLRLLRHPKYGYGRNMNPCLDCRLFMFELGRPYMEEHGARFLFTGEVVGQRPMSQTRSAIAAIDKRSGLEGWILRPLSAHVLPETEPERRGWVDRSRLLGLMGRGRTEQLALAERYGIRHVQSPGGGCLLTDAKFSERLRDLFAHTPEESTTTDDVALLRIGRHLRVDAGLKIVIGRDEAENLRLESFVAADRVLVRPLGWNAPAALICGAADERAIESAAAAIARHTRRVPDDAEVEVRGPHASRRVRMGAGMQIQEASTP
jgi:hypothetical protein